MLFINKLKSRKTSITFLFTLAFLLMLPVLAYASITSDVTSASGAGTAVGALQTSAQAAGDSFIKFLRTVAIIIAVVMFVVVSYSLLFSPNTKSIADAKGKIGALVMAIAISVLAEKIVGTLLSWLGYTQ